MQSALKTSDIDESGVKKTGPKGRLINFITSFNFIFDFAGKLLSQNPYLIAILYLHKFSYSELTSIKRYLEKGENFLGLDSWKEFMQSGDYKQVMTYFEKIFLLNKKAFEDSYNTILPAVAKKFGGEVAKGIEQNLGNNPES